MKRVLDVCCGGRMMWFDKNNPDALFLDNREMKETVLANRATFSVKPDKVMDFRALDLPDESFSLVVFDPPHYVTTGNGAWLVQKYGKLDKATWKEDLRKGFSECFRVLKPDGVLIFKWNEYKVPVRDVLELTSVQPLFGHRSGKASKTHWIAFIKPRATDLC